MFSAIDARELKALSNAALHQRNVGTAREERECTGRLLWQLKESEARKLYLEFEKCDSLYAYCIRELKMSNGSAGRRVNAARLLGEFPELSEKIVEGSTNLSNLSLMQTYVRAEEKRIGRKVPVEQKRELLERIEHKAGDDVELVLAQALPEAKPTQVSRRVRADEDVDYTIRFNPRILEKIERVRALNSHKREFGDLVGMIEALCDEHLERNDPAMRKPKRPKTPKVNPVAAQTPLKIQDPGCAEEGASPSARDLGNDEETSCAAPTAPSQPLTQVDLAARSPRSMHERRKQHSAKKERRLYQRAGSRCEHVDESGVRCTRRFHLQIDHIVPWTLGGSDDLENLQLLCRPHNLRKGMRVRERHLAYVA